MSKFKRIYIFILALVICYWAFFHLKSALGGQLSSDLSYQLPNLSAGSEVSVLVYLKKQANLKGMLINQNFLDRSQIYKSVLDELRRTADSEQSKFLANLDSWRKQGKISILKSFWVANVIALTGKREIIEKLAEDPEVEIVYPDYPVELVAPVEERLAISAGTEADQLQIAIGAKQVWQQGLTGKGRLVCILDTGVDGGHPALLQSWKGAHSALTTSWLDPLGAEFPRDDQGHGTHIAGIICARTLDDTIGIAPEAQWIAAAVIDRGTTKEVTISNILSAFQWALDPDGDPNTFEDVPDVINNSWGFPKNVYPDCEEIFWQAIDNVEAVGVAVVFAAGNEGPDPYTLRLPADRSSSPYNSFSVGAVAISDSGFEIAPFSSRGPSRCDSTKAKPEIVAPGVEIYSTYPNGQYRIMSGSSMAAPIVSAAVLILRQLDPEITVDQIKDVLTKSSKDQGPAGKDNDYGAGVINIAAAVEYWKHIKGWDKPAAVLPQDFRLAQNYPNPFNASTSIKYEVKQTASSTDKVTLKVYNVLGQQVKTLVEEPQAAGFYTVHWDGTDNRGQKMASGVYFYRLQAGDFTQTRRMAFLK
jgi:bacillopeptidase F